MHKGKVLVIVGPAGSGKSTAAKRFADEVEGVWAYISQDDTRDLIYAGWKSPMEEWADEVPVQWEVSHKITRDMMCRYQEAGINCVADGFSPNLRAEYAELARYLKGIEYKLVVIMPSLEKVLERNAQRTGSARLTDQQTRNLYGWYEEFIAEAKNATIINSTNLTLDEVVARLKDLSKDA